MYLQIIFKIFDRHIILDITIKVLVFGTVSEYNYEKP